LAVARNLNPKVTTTLIGFGADVNARTEDGDTALLLVAKYGTNAEIITILIDSGADGVAVDQDGKTPFDLAKENKALVGTDAYWALNELRFK